MSKPKPTEEPLFGPEPKPKTVRLVLSDPWCSQFNLPQEDGSTLVFDRQGTDVPAASVQDILDAAALHGVTITEVSN